MNGDATDVRRLDAAGLPDTAAAIRRADRDAAERRAIDAARTGGVPLGDAADTVPPALAAAGFVYAGVGSDGAPFYTRDRADGVVIVCGDESPGAGVWGASSYADRAAFNRDGFGSDGGRENVPGTYATPAALVAALETYPVRGGVSRVAD